MSEKEVRWSKPQLIVLGRGRSEERVLQACKHPNAQLPGADQQAAPYKCEAADGSGACKDRRVT
jgi:hypothetical protein